MSTLSAERCIACRRDSPRVTEAEIAELRREVSAWQLLERDGIARLERVFHFPNFTDALTFTNRVGALAEAEGSQGRRAAELGSARAGGRGCARSTRRSRKRGARPSMVNVATNRSDWLVSTICTPSNMRKSAHGPSNVHAARARGGPAARCDTRTWLRPPGPGNCTRHRHLRAVGVPHDLAVHVQDELAGSRRPSPRLELELDARGCRRRRGRRRRG